jgi:hypothetical protein
MQFTHPVLRHEKVERQHGHAKGFLRVGGIDPAKLHHFRKRNFELALKPLTSNNPSGPR